MTAMTASTPRPSLATDIAEAPQATAKYVTNLARANAAGHQIITMMMPDVGYHFLNPKIQGFNVRKPQILVYEHTGSGWQLGALEWVFTSEPKTPPLPNATFGFFPAACHYKDGTFIPHKKAATCPKRAPGSGAPVFLLAPRSGDHARVRLVPQPRWALREHQPASRPLQQGLTGQRSPRAGRASRDPPAVPDATPSAGLAAHSLDSCANQAGASTTGEGTGLT
jgi:hypothetical protein